MPKSYKVIGGPRKGPNLEVEITLGETAKEEISIHGDDLVKKFFDRIAIAQAQTKIRTLVKLKTAPEMIVEIMSTWQPALGKQSKSIVDKSLDEFETMDLADQEAWMEKMAERRRLTLEKSETAEIMIVEAPEKIAKRPHKKKT